MSKGVLLLNLGSPDAPEPEPVRRYLREFLGDARVLDAPAPIRWFVLNCFILPFRPKKSAEAYSRVWTPEGAPLLVISRRVRDLVARGLGIPVALGMRYGNPSTAAAVEELRKAGVTEVFVMPLYPHYAMSSYESALVCASNELRRQIPQVKMHILQPFYGEPDYIDALVESARPHLERGFDKLLFSFHGLPERHLRKGDPSHAHCLCSADCCSVANPAHATCYRHQCYRTVELFAERAGLKPGQYEVSFQSRLGRDPWLKPYTDFRLADLPREGVKRLLVISPAFVSDCLETLEELSITGRETFIAAGGKEFAQIPCLNEHPRWISFLRTRIDAWRGGAQG